MNCFNKLLEAIGAGVEAKTGVSLQDGAQPRIEEGLPEFEPVVGSWAPVSSSSIRSTGDGFQ